MKKEAKRLPDSDSFAVDFDKRACLLYDIPSISHGSVIRNSWNE